MNTKNNSLDKYLQENGIWRLPNAENALFHYTGMRSAAAIIQEGVLCFNAKFMRDKNEFELGRYFMMLHPCNTGNDVSWEELCAGAESDVRCWTFSMCGNNNNQAVFRKFACGKEGGPAIVAFDFTYLCDKVNEAMEQDIKSMDDLESKRCYHFILPCLYATQDRDAILKLKDFLFGRYLKELGSLYEGKLTARELAFACSYIFRAMVKADQFKNENEYRLIKITFDGCDKRSIPSGIDCHRELIGMSAFCSSPISSDRNCVEAQRIYQTFEE